MPRCPSRGRVRVLAVDSKRSTTHQPHLGRKFSDNCRRIIEHKHLAKAVELGAADTLKIVVTTQDGRTAKRPHQAFLLLKDVESGLDISYPFSIKDSGKGKVDLVGIIIRTELWMSLTSGRLRKICPHNS